MTSTFGQVVAYSLLLTSSSCASVALSSAGERIELVSESPGPACANLGVIIGTSGNIFSGSFTSNAKLVRSAINDVRNQAAAKGATHLDMSDPQLGSQDGTTSTATVSAIAYRCVPAPVAPVSPAP